MVMSIRSKKRENVRLLGLCVEFSSLLVCVDHQVADGKDDGRRVEKRGVVE